MPTKQFRWITNINSFETALRHSNLKAGFSFRKVVIHAEQSVSPLFGGGCLELFSAYRLRLKGFIDHCLTACRSFHCRTSRNFTMVKAEISPRCCRNFTTVAFPLHHGGVLTAPRWSFYGTMVEWHRHRGVFPDFTMVEFFLHHGVFSKKGGGSKSPWWRAFEPSLEALQNFSGDLLSKR